jgi:D-glycero-alpha-D-manno-heptose-7-phosphate kinase
MIVRAKAPFRVSFGGGGTDLPPYCWEHGGCIINTAIDRHINLSIAPRENEWFNVYSVDVDRTFKFKLGDTDYTGDLDLVKATINALDVSNGFDITIQSELPAGSGMGGSSSLVVALIGAFNEHYDWNLSREEIAMKAYNIERIDLQQSGGYQDQYAASLGGFNFMEFTREVKVHPIKATTEMLNELQCHLILCYVGGSHFSSTIQDEVIRGYEDEKSSYLDAMDQLKEVARGMRRILEQNNLTKMLEFGELLHQGWLAKKSLSSKISNQSVENFYLTSRKFGVIGGKLLGAGGGGHLILFSDPAKKYNVMKELQKIGATIVNFHFNPNGLETWKVKKY